MKIIGIIAEYNPFHNGHKLQIEYAKNYLNADCVIVAMSGSFTQRGNIAGFNKYSRAHAALLNGADIIFEIPTIFSTASAREYATCATKLLDSTGICDAILFGTETKNIDKIEKNVNALISFDKYDANTDEFKALLKSGQTYSLARSNFIFKHYKTQLSSTANDILATEYIKSIKENKLTLEYYNLPRVQNDYHDTSFTGKISSATAIRNALSENKAIDNYVPTSTFFSPAKYISPDDISQMLYYKLLLETDFAKYSDVSTELNYKIKHTKRDFSSFSNYCDLLKSKEINHSRISRALCHILLNISIEDMENAKHQDYNTYLRLLGFSKNGREYLKHIKCNSPLPIISKPNDRICRFDIISSDILRGIEAIKTNATIPNEYSRKFDLVDI